MGPVPVVMIHEDGEDPLEVLLIQDQQPVKMSTASMLRRCASRNSRHVIPRRVPTGPRPAVRSQVRTVVAETGNPQALQLANDALITPARIVSREAHDESSDLRANRRATGLTRVCPTLRHQAAVPGKQGRRCDDEGPPACARQEPAGRRQDDPVGPCQRRAAGSSPEDGEFVPQHDDFQFLEIVRANAQSNNLQNPSKHHVTKREEHEASSVGRQPSYSTHPP
jgi:hypothetical protein